MYLSIMTDKISQHGFDKQDAKFLIYQNRIIYNYKLKLK